MPTPHLVLIIDDSDATRMIEARALCRTGYSVIEAGTAEAGLKAIREQKPDMIVLDVGLPDVDGREFCRVLKEDPEFRYIPILMCTGHAQVSDRVAGLSMGADDYLTKPFQAVELVARVEALFRRVQMSEQKAEEAQRPVEAPPPAAELAAAPPPMQAAEVRPSSPSNWELARGYLSALYEPSRALSEPGSGTATLIPAGAWSLMAFGAVWAGPPAGWLAFLKALVIPIAAWSGAAGICFLTLPASRRRESLRDCARLSALAVMPLLLSQALTLVYTLATGGAASGFTGNVFVLAGFFPAGHWTQRIIAAPDVFVLWAAALLGWGAVRSMSLSLRRSAIAGISGWLFLILLLGFIGR